MNTPATEPSAKTGHEVIEAALKLAIKGDPADAPFPLDHDQAAIWHQASASAYQHALEMIPSPAAAVGGGEVAAYQYQTGEHDWRDCTPQVYLSMQTKGIGVRKVYSTPPTGGFMVEKCNWRGALRGDGKCPQCGIIHNLWPCACAAVEAGLAERCGRHDKPAQPSAKDGVMGEGAVHPMTAKRATYFLRRFKHDEKLLGPNEQLALDYCIAMLEATTAADLVDGVPTIRFDGDAVEAVVQHLLTAGYTCDGDYEDFFMGVKNGMEAAIGSEVGE